MVTQFHLPSKKHIPSKKSIRITSTIAGVQSDYFVETIKRKRGAGKIQYTEIRDSSGLLLLSSKKPRKNIIAQLTQKKSVTFSKGDKEFSYEAPKLPLRAYNAEILSAKTQTLHVRTAQPIERRVGKLNMGITFYGQGKEKHTAVASSARVHLLTDPEGRDRAFDEAFRGAMSSLPFSYTSFKINWISYSYYIRKDKIYALRGHGLLKAQGRL